MSEQLTVRTCSNLWDPGGMQGTGCRTGDPGKLQRTEILRPQPPNHSEGEILKPSWLQQAWVTQSCLLLQTGCQVLTRDFIKNLVRG